MIVYLDLLILDNFCADASLLYLAVKTVRGKVSLMRIFLVALFGTIAGVGYTIFSIYYTLPKIVDLFIKYSVAAVLPLFAAKFRKKSSYALLSLAFCVYMFAFSGLLTAFFSEFVLTGENVYTVNAVPSGIIVAASVVFSVAAVKLFGFLASRVKLNGMIFDCRLSFKGQQIKTKGLCDTGNRLRTSKGKEVAVADRSIAWALLNSKNSKIHTAFEKVPVKTVNGNSYMTVFTIDKIEIYCGNHANIIEDVAIGISGESLGEYGLILPPSFTNEEK